MCSLCAAVRRAEARVPGIAPWFAGKAGKPHMLLGFAECARTRHARARCDCCVKRNETPDSGQRWTLYRAMQLTLKKNTTRRLCRYLVMSIDIVHTASTGKPTVAMRTETLCCCAII
jgi:hypothetical protein